jgi:hypothetical protein
MSLNQQPIDLVESDKVTWLASKISSVIPGMVNGLTFYTLDCGCDCIYYQRVSRNGDLDPQVGIYRNAEDGPCDVRMGMSIITL